MFGKKIGGVCFLVLTVAVMVWQGQPSVSASSFKNDDKAADVQRYPAATGSVPKAAAKEEAGKVSGVCGAAVAYTIDLASGKVTLSGSGAVENYEYATDSPFYAYKDRIRSLEIGEGVTSIGDNAFAFCFDLARVHFSSTVTSVGKYAFLGCVSYHLALVPSGVKNIGDHAFGYYCDNGTEGIFQKQGDVVILGEKGSAAEAYAASEDNEISFVDESQISHKCGDNLTWTFDLDTGVLRISGNGAMPDYSMAGMTTSAPYNIYRFYVTSVAIDKGVTGIGNYAFYNFNRLRTVTLPDGLTSVGTDAFYNCGELLKLQLPSGLATIGDRAFISCSGLEDITIPSSVTAIGKDAFKDCASLAGIEVENGNASYASHNGILCDKNQSRLVLLPRNYPDSVVTVPAGITALDPYAIYHCLNVRSLVFEGTAPTGMSRYYQKLDHALVYCDLSDKSWEDLKNGWEEGNGIWVDASDLTGETLSIDALSDMLSVGGHEQLTAVIDPDLAAEFVWSSGDETVAIVSDTGNVRAVAPGTAKICAESADGKYSAEMQLTVTGEAFSMPEHHLEMLKDELNYTSTYTVTKQIVSEKLHGVYFLNGPKLGFYSFTDKSYEIVKTFGGCSSAFAANERLYVLDESSCYIYDLTRQCVTGSFAVNGCVPSAVGADADGRVYVAGYETGCTYKNKILLFSPEGELLSDVTVGTAVRAFSGFDKKTGYFYMESDYNYYSWGYSHSGRGLTMGKVTENTLKYIDTRYSFLEGGMITRTMSCLLYLCQDSYMEHQTSADLLGGRYLTAVSVLNGTVNVYDSNTARDDGITQIMSLARAAGEGDETDSYLDCTSVGVRAVYNERNESMIVYENDCTLTEYDLATGEKISSFKTEHRVFNLLMMGDSLIAVEREQNEGVSDVSYYLELVDWGAPDDLRLTAERDTMKPGTAQMLSLESSASYEILPRWSSSDNHILSVTQNGKVTAWRQGTAVVTAKVSESVSRSVTITVTESDIISPENNVTVKNGANTSNYSANNYSVWSSTVDSYIMENADGTLATVEYVPGTGVQVNVYSKEYELISGKVLPMELPLFGGFYGGTDANFVVFGQTNEAENDSAEVMRVVKYSKDWVRLGQTSVRGANTYIPFDAGSLRMAETADGRLYIHTCHEMYESGDGLHHQANMTYVLNEASMEMEQSYYDVMNIAQAGYVSHSFNQFVQTDGQYVFRVDHGDANPRAVSLVRCSVDGKITDVSYVLPLEIETDGYNETGVSVGGLELSSDNCLIVGNSVKQELEEVSGSRNIFLSVTSKTLTSARMVWLTEYEPQSNVATRTPHIVKLNDEQFVVMWEEYDRASGKTTMKMVNVDGNGDIASEIVETRLRLSDCKPVVMTDGLVRWYVTDGDSMVFCQINPYDLESVEGSVEISGQGGLPDDNDQWWDPEFEPTPGTGGDDNDQWWDSEFEPGPGTGENGSDKWDMGMVVLRDNILYYATGRNQLECAVGRSARGAVVIPDKFTVNGTIYKVTSIAANAFKNNKSVTSVKIGRNVTSIGKNAFYKCKKLKKITVKSKKLKKVGKGAIKGIYKKAVIKVPKSRRKKYKKLFKKKVGYRKSMRLKV